MDDNASNSGHSGYIITAYSIFTLSCHMVSILLANVYVNNIEEWLLRGSLLLCYKMLKNSKISKKLETGSIKCDFYKIQF